MKAKVFFLILSSICASLQVSGQGINITSGGHLTAIGAATIEIKSGNFINDGTYTKGMETFTMSGATTARTMSGSSNTDLYNLSITNTAGITTQLGLLTTNNLTIASGSKFTIDPGKSVTVGNDLTNNVANGLIVNSNISSSGSLIIGGTSSGSGTATYNRWMTKDKWHLVSSPVVGQAITLADFFTPGNIAHFTASTVEYYGLADYNESTNSWNGFFPSTVISSFASGKGYEIRRGTPGDNNDGIVSFTGTPGVPLTGYPITRTASPGQGWNCVGNPFTSAIGITSLSSSTDKFLTTNSGALDPSYGAVYVWVQGELEYDYSKTTRYQAISNSGYNPLETPYTTISGEYYVQVGQGFFVKSKTSGGNLQFTSGMQIHMPTVTYKSKPDSWPGMSLIAALKDTRSFTDITFYQGMTKGLDPTYDAGLLRADPDFVLYTRLIEDNGVDFSLQCLPDNDYNKLVIPIGLDCKAGGQVKFSARPVNLPEKCKPFLEDRQTRIVTDLSIPGSSYSVTVPANTKGTGRFYLYTSRIVSGVEDDEDPGLVIYSFDKEIHIEGLVHDHTLANLYDMSGKSIGTFKLVPSTINILRPVRATAGTYLLVLQNGEMCVSKKLNLN